MHFAFSRPLVLAMASTLVATLILTDRASAQSTGVCPQQLSSTIGAIVDRPEYQRYRWGISVKTQQGTSIYDRDGDKLFTPASNLKLVTTAVALRYLGANNRLRTSIYQLPATTTSKGTNLLVVGRGDPTITPIQIQTLAQQIQQRGIRQINSIDFDDGYFRGDAINSTWQWGDLSTDYAPSINSLMVNQNGLKLTISPQKPGMPLAYSWQDSSLSTWAIDNRGITAAANSQGNVNVTPIFAQPTLRIAGKLPENSEPITFDLATANPTETFTNILRSSLDRLQVNTLKTRTVYGQNSNGLTEVAAINSPTIAQLIAETNLRSNNIYAEVLLKSIGRTHPQYATASDDATDLGLASVKQALTSLGISSQSYRLNDGSGLSRHNLISPNALVQLAISMSRTPEAKIYRDSLPVGGMSGTLRNRFKGTPAQGIVFAKTGSMTSVIGLSGYITPSQYSPLAFSIIVNQHDRSTSAMSKVIDEIVVALARLKQC
jgi:serine-type D-Ala-D-Ala carboxypeptidase/endopeptidase (penicillin-binding protein 4)